MAKDHLDAEAVRAAQGVLDAFMKAFNARDIPAFEATFNFPSVRLADKGDVLAFEEADVTLEHYQAHKSIKAPIAV